jgi:predicted RNase H-like HicB family nuclease
MRKPKFENRKTAQGRKLPGHGAGPSLLQPIFRVEVEREKDGRWIAEFPELPGVLAYGAAREEAITRARELSSWVLAERLDHGEDVPW